MASEQNAGALLVALAATLNIGNLVLNKVLVNLEMPYYRMTGVACVVAAIAFTAGWLRSSAESLSRRSAMWIILRGLFGGALAFVFMLLAEHLGVPLGDIGALNSINIVISAVFGKALLGEPFTWLHAFGTACSVAGAVLISQPSFIFGGGSEGGEAGAGLGYVLAIASAVAMALNFFAGRKSRGASTRLLTASALYLRGLSLLSLVPSGIVEDYSLEALGQTPAQAVAWFGLLALFMVTAMMASSAGSSRCPVAVASVIFTGVNMAGGYLAQTLLFHSPPKILTLVGASLMLVAVVATSQANLRASRVQAASAKASSSEEVDARKCGTGDADSNCSTIDTQTNPPEPEP